ncbi:MAG: MarR family transcriptional regulator [Oscillospiraceae bacterium]|nr:MarR family transcriptional regulator [Oscillospiraceae bacterium]
MTENINFELLKELRKAGAKVTHPGKPGPDHKMMGDRRPPMGEHFGMPHNCDRRPMEGKDPFRNVEMHKHGPMHGPGKDGHGNDRPLPREFVLSLLLDNGNEGIRQKDLADKLGIRSAAMSEAINKLEDNGYIERKVDETDRRATLIFLTEKGEARANEVKDQRQHRFDRIFGDLTDAEKEQLLMLLKKMNGSLSQE